VPPTATPRQEDIPSLNEHIRGGQSKVDRYGWKLIDKPGVYENIDKKRLGIDESYQRPEIVSKIREMSANWSWMACGVILVARRGKRFYVYDGQQRTAAAMRRSDIKTLPCLVFDTEGAPEEAEAFVRSNTMRRPVEAIWKFRALVVAGDQAAIELSRALEAKGYRVNDSGSSPRALRCIRALQEAYKTNKACFARVWPLVADMHRGQQVHHKVFAGLFWLECQLEDQKISLTKEPWRARALKLGPAGIREATAKASAFYAGGGYKVWGLGVLQALNKGLPERRRLRLGETD
jgi:hypothetical protein